VGEMGKINDFSSWNVDTRAFSPLLVGRLLTLLLLLCFKSKGRGGRKTIGFW